MDELQPKHVLIGFAIGLLGGLALVCAVFYKLSVAYKVMLSTARTPWIFRSLRGELFLSVLFQLSKVLRKCGFASYVDRGTQSMGIEKIPLLEATVRQKSNANSQIVCFVGSSTFTFWRHIEEDFQSLGEDVVVLNSGFGGSCTHDILPLAHRLCLQFNPSVVVYYCGTNNIAMGLSDESILKDFQAFLALLWDKCPNTQVIYLGLVLTPFYCKSNVNNSIQRCQQLNMQIKQFCVEHCKAQQLSFVDANHCSWIRDSNLYLGDAHHLTDEGHTQLASHLLPVISNKLTMKSN